MVKFTALVAGAWFESHLHYWDSSFVTLAVVKPINLSMCQWAHLYNEVITVPVSCLLWKTMIHAKKKKKKGRLVPAHGKQSIKVNYSFYLRKTATSVPSQFGFFVFHNFLIIFYPFYFP